MIKKYLLITLASLAIVNATQAWVRVHNKTPWPIKFQYYFDGGENSFNYIAPGDTQEDRRDAWNIKRRYIVSIPSEMPVKDVYNITWVPKLDTATQYGGNQDVTVVPNITDLKAGKLVITLETKDYV